MLCLCSRSIPSLPPFPPSPKSILSTIPSLHVGSPANWERCRTVDSYPHTLFLIDARVFLPRLFESITGRCDKSLPTSSYNPAKQAPYRITARRDLRAWYHSSLCPLPEHAPPTYRTVPRCKLYCHAGKTFTHLGGPTGGYVHQ